MMHARYLDEKKNLFLETRNEVKAIQDRYKDMDIWVRP